MFGIDQAYSVTSASTARISTASISARNKLSGKVSVAKLNADTPDACCGAGGREPQLEERGGRAASKLRSGELEEPTLQSKAARAAGALCHLHITVLRDAWSLHAVLLLAFAVFSFLPSLLFVFLPPRRVWKEEGS